MDSELKHDGIEADAVENTLPEESTEKKYVVRHNKQDVELTLAQLIENAEKGLDYDRIRPSHDFIKELAAKNGESDISRFIAKMKNGQNGAANASLGPLPEQNVACDEKEMEAILREYPEFVEDGTFKLPDDVLALQRGGMSIIEACRAADLKRTKTLCAKLSARLDAICANTENRAASIGSLSGGKAVEKDFFTSQEWDRLPRREKEKFIKNGKIYEFMKKWSGK